MRARSFSHVGLTVSDFNRTVRFYWDVFGCPLVGVADTPPERVRSFFGVESDAPSCKIGWIRVPGGGVLEIFAFAPLYGAIINQENFHGAGIGRNSFVNSPNKRCGRRPIRARLTWEQRLQAHWASATPI